LQNDRLLNTASTSTRTRNPSFTAVASVVPEKPCRMILGRVTCKAEAGHMRQNEYIVASPRRKGSKTTVRASMIYLR
jgi:hypothetical protein